MANSTVSRIVYNALCKSLKLWHLEKILILFMVIVAVNRMLKNLDHVVGFDFSGLALNIFPIHYCVVCVQEEKTVFMVAS